MTPPNGSSPPWCIRLTAEFHDADRRARSLAQSLTAQQLNWPPRPGSWSIGQCLEHLRVSNEVYLRPMGAALAGRPVAVVQEVAPGWLGRWFIRTYIEPGAGVGRAPAPRKIRPLKQVDPAILERFLDSNAQARDLVLSARNLDVNRIRFRNPFVPVIYFTIGTGLEILSRHQRRHLDQAERVRKSPGFPA